MIVLFVFMLIDNQIRLQTGQTRVRTSYSSFIPGGDEPPLFDTFSKAQERISR